AGHSIQALTGEPSKPWKVRSSTWSVRSGVDSGRRSTPLAAPCCARVRAQKASVSAAVGAAPLPRAVPAGAPTGDCDCDADADVSALRPASLPLVSLPGHGVRTPAGPTAAPPHERCTSFSSLAFDRRDP